MGFFCFLFFASEIWEVEFFGDIWVLGGPTFSAKKKEGKKNIRKGLGKGTLNTCAKFQGLTLKNGVDIWTFAWLSAKITAWHRNYLVLVSTRF